MFALARFVPWQRFIGWRGEGHAVSNVYCHDEKCAFRRTSSSGRAQGNIAEWALMDFVIGSCIGWIISFVGVFQKDPKFNRKCLWVELATA